MPRSRRERHGCQLFINDYWHLAIEEDCDFIALGQEDLAAANVKRIRKAGKANRRQRSHHCIILTRSSRA
ncbi:thiamine phosphate synthase [Mesorhizobium abyssinicae]|uniref:thiamine phosphate synthase n=1 Tax=Mesorhizobium abyssinicae TaxID=1209958 RepID=UPI003CF30B1B